MCGFPDVRKPINYEKEQEKVNMCLAEFQLILVLVYRYEGSNNGTTFWGLL